jgi:hypothetical protein
MVCRFTDLGCDRGSTGSNGGLPVDLLCVLGTIAESLCPAIVGLDLCDRTTEQRRVVPCTQGIGETLTSGVDSFVHFRSFTRAEITRGARARVPSCREGTEPAGCRVGKTTMVGGIRRAGPARRGCGSNMLARCGSSTRRMSWIRWHLSVGIARLASSEKVLTEADVTKGIHETHQQTASFTSLASRPS